MDTQSSRPLYLLADLHHSGWQQDETQGCLIVTKAFVPNVPRGSVPESSFADFQSRHTVPAPVQGGNELQVKKGKSRRSREEGDSKHQKTQDELCLWQKFLWYYCLITSSSYFTIVSTASGSREQHGFASLHGPWASMLGSFPHAPKLVSAGNFTPSPRRPPSRTSKPKASLQQELGKLHWVSAQLLVVGSDTGLSKGIFLWRLLNPLEGLCRRTSGLPSPTSCIVLDSCTAQEGTDAIQLLSRTSEVPCLPRQ